jgi:hypothetical protein
MDTPKLEEALDGAAVGTPVVLLAHQPNQAVEAAGLGGRVQLQLSGHVHGGQTWPLHLGTFVAVRRLA